MLSSEEFDLENYIPIPVKYQLRYSILEKIKKGEDPLPDIDGRYKVKRDVMRTLISCAHPYLVSREGTGKTRLAESLVKLLPPIPKIKGCPYNDDPKWTKHWLCPRCKSAENPAEEYGIELISGKERYSRIQGNEYTNEAKILGLKDIQAIAQGESPTNPKVFMGTGVLRGNRGIVCIDELPAIPTKVQVLFHPMLQENKIILEEYNWERPIDICFIATGNPLGFSHVNRIPEPLLDRLELIHLDMPDENVEKEIMFKEKFKIIDNYFYIVKQKTKTIFSKQNYDSLKRRSAVPWWIANIVNKTVRYTRECPNIDKGASIRGTIKAIDHTYSTVEMRRGYVANLKDAYNGLNLALRGRLKLRADLLNFEDKATEYYKKSAQVVEDIMWYASKESINYIFKGGDFNLKKLGVEINLWLSEGLEMSTNKLPQYPEIERMIIWLKGITPEKALHLNEWEKEFLYNSDQVDKIRLEEYNLSALEMIINFGIHKNLVEEALGRKMIFVPRRMKI